MISYLYFYGLLNFLQWANLLYDSNNIKSENDDDHNDDEAAIFTKNVIDLCFTLYIHSLIFFSQLWFNCHHYPLNTRNECRILMQINNFEVEKLCSYMEMTEPALKTIIRKIYNKNNTWVFDKVCKMNPT